MPPFWKKVDKQQQVDALFLAIKENDLPKAKKLVPMRCGTPPSREQGTCRCCVLRFLRARAGSMMQTRRAVLR
jgi:hypothetical protein